MLARRTMYELQYNRQDRAKIYLKKIKKDIPDYKLPLMLQSIPTED
jgi:hypothetical protein